MKIFISSLIVGMEPLRDAARDAIESLGHEAVLAEDFSALPTSPQNACLSAVRRSDAVVLILGELYGGVQASGLSATHEEYREARGTKPVLAFVQGGADFESRQAEFLREVQGWDSGLFRGEFSDSASLRRLVSQQLHRWELANAAGPPNGEELLRRALDLIDHDSLARNRQVPQLVVSVVGGPTQAILRPSELEEPALGQEILKEALFATAPLFDSAKGASPSIREHTLMLRETGEESHLALSEDGSILIAGRIRRPQASYGLLPTLIEEDVRQQLATSLAFADWLLERIDPTERLTHVSLAAKISDSGGFAAWRTLAEAAASPNRVAVGFHQTPPGAVHLAPSLRPRAALRVGRSSLVDDLLTLLRREWRR
jgi:hypothetical protein